MSGGVLLPGNATVADVNAGKTFSSAAGVGVMGSATLLPAGLVVGNWVPTSGASGTSLTISPTVVSASDTLILFTACGSTLSLTSVSGAGATWSKLVGVAGGGFNGGAVEIWIGTSPTAGAGTVTVSQSSNIANYGMSLVELSGPWSLRGSLTGTHISPQNNPSISGVALTPNAGDMYIYAANAPAGFISPPIPPTSNGPGIQCFPLSFPNGPTGFQSGLLANCPNSSIQVNWTIPSNIDNGSYACAAVLMP